MIYVMAGLGPAIHVFLLPVGPKTWMPATSAGMTAISQIVFEFSLTPIP
jgi:hypothetical protein